MKIARYVFLAIFLLSLVAYVVLALAQRGYTIGPNAPVETELSPWIPLITAIGSLIGVATTSIISLRRDRLESQKIELEMKKIQLEIDRLQQDIDNELGKKHLD
jgi:hypothetical protein